MTDTVEFPRWLRNNAAWGLGGDRPAINSITLNKGFLFYEDEGCFSSDHRVHLALNGGTSDRLLLRYA